MTAIKLTIPRSLTPLLKQGPADIYIYIYIYIYIILLFFLFGFGHPTVARFRRPCSRPGGQGVESTATDAKAGH